LGVHHHDPQDDGFTVQALEAGLTLAPSEQFSLFGVGTLHWDKEEKWSAEFEEGYFQLKELSGVLAPLEVRGGKYLNRFGLTNHRHAHSWQFLDQAVPLGRYLGEEGLVTEGGELNWKMPWSSLAEEATLTVSYGKAPQHSHEEHGEEEAEEEEEQFHGEDAGFAKEFFSANLTQRFQPTDFQLYRLGASIAHGENLLGGDTTLYGVHGEIEWREKGLQSGGKYVRVASEFIFRKFDSPEASAKDWGNTTQLIYGSESHIGPVEAGIRFDYVSGEAAAELEERWRISPVLTWYLNSARQAHLRLQYNYDRGEEFGTSHGIWAQVGFNWSGH
jgi:hypothetical protein